MPSQLLLLAGDGGGFFFLGASANPPVFGIHAADRPTASIRPHNFTSRALHMAGTARSVLPMHPGFLNQKF
jgi:hypothetical protein